MPLLQAHLRDIEARLDPGLHLLIWTSLNIDGYLHHLSQVWCMNSIFYNLNSH